MSHSSLSMVELARGYLAHRRSFGFLLRAEGYDLLAFARFLDRTAPGQPLSAKLTLQWLKRKPAQSVTIAHRLSAIRCFARYCATLDPKTQIPPTNLTPYRNSRGTPHIFTDDQLRLILQRTKRLRPWRNELRPLTYRTLIGLLICTGIRPSEALRLQDEHLDVTAGTLHIPAVKRSSGRTLPLHPSTVRALQRYQDIRRSHYPLSSHLFVGPFGRPLRITAADWTFRRLARGMVGNGSWPNPRLYDLRHLFATRWIARWARQSAPLVHRLVLLSRYLGHKDFHDTYWYVQPESSALQKAADRFEQYRHPPTST